ncbi:UDP-N-acetylmuramoyl-L-alanine--D-glutamate ligase [Thermoleophilia bacterium SCSIO 60948]|nr:UDP-N-acetylmuramoyl-L-alanine--D-glutamate ligase [Thermoleophilia bacterium SCSIO 60948]
MVLDRPLKPRPPLPGGPYLVVGLARSGQAIARTLRALGEEVRAADSGHPEGAEGLEALGVELHLDADGLELIDGARCVVKSPGVPSHAPAIEAARTRGKPVLGELELAWRLLPNRFVAITGTNGKTTVTELLGHVWRTAGEPVAVAGNVGTPLSSLAGTLDPDATVVCECSSFQLEDTSEFAPECALILNLTPDHLDRHGDFAAYRDAKLRIFANQGNDDLAIYPADDPELASLDLGGCGSRVAFCSADAANPDCDVIVEPAAIVAGGEALVDRSELRILGPHNALNAAAAAAAALGMGLERDTVAEALRSFPGVAHRLELVARRDGVAYVNDSKATNVAAALAAITSFPSGVRVILGGSLKGGDFVGLGAAVAEHCASAHLTGPAAEPIARELEGAGSAGVDVSVAADLPAAVMAAHRAAKPGDTVLLAPACASFDAYENYERRGEHFRALVGEILRGEEER